jgi:hypothetical protein
MKRPRAFAIPGKHVGVPGGDRSQLIDPGRVLQERDHLAELADMV